MFSFLKKRKTCRTEEEYVAEYERRLKLLDGVFTEQLETVQDQLICSIGVLDKCFNYNGGCSWDREGYSEYFDIIQDVLLNAEILAPVEREIKQAIQQILLCGKELDEVGESAIDAESAINYLRDRAIDWVLANPNPIPTEKDDGYIGHF